VNHADFNYGYDSGYHDGMKDWHATILRVLDEIPAPDLHTVDMVRRWIVDLYNE
jgi:hypothetical protein